MKKIIKKHVSPHPEGLLSFTISLDIALSNYLLESKDLEVDYALPIKNLRKRY